MNKYRIGKLAEFEDVASDYFNNVKMLRAVKLPITENHAHYAGEFEWEHRKKNIKITTFKRDGNMPSMCLCEPKHGGHVFSPEPLAPLIPLTPLIPLITFGTL